MLTDKCIEETQIEKSGYSPDPVEIFRGRVLLSCSVELELLRMVLRDSSIELPEELLFLLDRTPGFWIFN